MSIEIVILAAGKGSRMRSKLPKVLHPLASKPILFHVIDCAVKLNPSRIHVVVGHEAAQIVSTVESQANAPEINWVEQKKQKGTGHAVAQAINAIDEQSTVLVMAGDVPLIQADTVAPLTLVEQGIHLLTVHLDDPTGFGRIMRTADGAVTKIVEHKDANAKELAIAEINTGVMAMPARQLAGWLQRLDNNNAQGQYYLTDVIGLAHSDGYAVSAVLAENANEVAGINSRAELAKLERAYQQCKAETYMQSGVSFADPSRVDFRGECAFGQDVFVDVNVIFEGQVSIGDGVTIGPNVVIKDSTIANHCRIEANSVVEQSTLGASCHIGPYARLRPDTHLAAQAKIGNFVEIKKSEIGERSKVNHLSYIGDSVVGKDVNIGAGVITCNYDGANKHQTLIGDDVFVGSDCQLVAPVEIGAGATIGAGSTIVKPVAAEKLTLSRSPQCSIDGWQRPTKTNSQE